MSIDVDPVTPDWLSPRIEPSEGSFMPIGTDDFDWRLDINTVAGSWCRAATIIGDGATSTEIDGGTCEYAISLR